MTDGGLACLVPGWPVQAPAHKGKHAPCVLDAMGRAAFTGEFPADRHGYKSPAAAALGIAAGDNPERMKSEAAFASLCGAAPIEAPDGRAVRYRLNRRGSRQANRALHTIALSRMGHDGRAVICRSHEMPLDTPQ